MKNLLLYLILIFNTQMMAQSTIHDFKVNDIEGNLFDFQVLKGKKIMIVNVASKCGLTPQYEELQSIYSKYEKDDFVIIAFPANNFLSQEPGSNEEIASFCQKNYGVTFPVMSKIDVKGKNIHPLYEYLTKKELNGHSDNEVTWNFQKYLINGDGLIDKVISPRTKPDDEEIISWIESNE
jgi:glutathione peroxidase